jgi:hypothetical protein
VPASAPHPPRIPALLTSLVILPPTRTLLLTPFVRGVLSRASKPASNSPSVTPSFRATIGSVPRVKISLTAPAAQSFTTRTTHSSPTHNPTPSRLQPLAPPLPRHNRGTYPHAQPLRRQPPSPLSPERCSGFVSFGVAESNTVTVPVRPVIKTSRCHP